MEKAKVEIQEREEKKALTAGAVGASDAPKMNIKVGVVYLLQCSIDQFSRCGGRVQRWVEGHELVINCQHSSPKPTRIGKLWKIVSLKAEETGRRRETSMVRARC